MDDVIFNIILYAVSNVAPFKIGGFEIFYLHKSSSWDVPSLGRKNRPSCLYKKDK